MFKWICFKFIILNYYFPYTLMNRREKIDKFKFTYSISYLQVETKCSL